MTEKFDILYYLGFEKIEYKGSIKTNDIEIPVWYFKNHYDKDKHDILFKSDYIIITKENIKQDEVKKSLESNTKKLKEYIHYYNKGYYNFYTPAKFKKYCRKTFDEYYIKLHDNMDLKFYHKNKPKLLYYNSKENYGQCDYNNVIKLSKKLIFYRNREIRETIIHELIHTIKGCRNHEKKFQHNLNWLLYE